MKIKNELNMSNYMFKYFIYNYYEYISFIPY